MFKTVKIINGYEIKKMDGFRYYTVNIPEDNGIGWKDFFEFKTLKEAIEFCERH